MMIHSAWEQLHGHMTMHGSLDDMVAYVQDNIERLVEGFHRGPWGLLEGSQRSDFPVLDSNQPTHSDPV